ncbi:hypothetical protein KC331_g8568 [Hortaea werneckii]|uniref:DUF7730 domain-containing protein n=1 Tax=Hortaea werneckii TaxID=91943 RepID=A0A3M7AU17_HORWE|nr:hypothetical protein KC331_g8568 [Hortaea werneckii]KAI7706711.1 hypothetical protein KC353_g12087 [Hortaea werneckii]RMY31044.1 hypothetical protein D0865_15104 [Hortaea werneckii]
MQKAASTRRPPEVTQCFSFGAEIMIESGRYTGLQAIVLTPTTAFPFESLPAELRQMVYERVFCRDCTISMKYARWHHSNSTCPQSTPYRQSVSFISTRSKPRYISLSMTNKLIYTEAIPFLYKGHDIVFNSMNQFNDFVQFLGLSARFLTSAMITKSGSKLTERYYTLLNQLESLQKITITLPAVPTERLLVHIEKHWEHAKLFLLSAGVDEEESKRRLSLITLRVGPTQRNVVGSDGKVIKVITAEINEVCKRYLMQKISKHFQTGTVTTRH